MGGDVVICHNRLRDEIFDLCRRAHLNVSVERSHGLTRDLDHTRPADILIAGWDRGKPAALDITITSLLCPAILGESSHQAGVAALAAEAHKLHSNGPKCQELGWSCILLAVETYGNWGKEAHDTISRLASHLAIHQSSPKSSVVAEIYGRLNNALIRFIARAILARELLPSNFLCLCLVFCSYIRVHDYYVSGNILLGGVNCISRLLALVHVPPPCQLYSIRRSLPKNIII